MRRSLLAAPLAAIAVAACGPSAPPPSTPAPTPSASVAAEPTVDDWIARLTKPATRATAARRLSDVLVEATRLPTWRDDPGARATVDRVLPPLVQATDDTLEPSARREVAKALFATGDRRIAPFVRKVMKDFAEGTGSPFDMVEAARFVAKEKPEGMGEALLLAFLAVDPSKRELGPPYQPTQAAMLAVAERAWIPTLVDILRRPLPESASRETKLYEVYHQIVAAMVLGELHAEEAVKPLYAVLLTPSKKDVAPTAVAALFKLGKVAEPVGLALAAGKDPELAALAKKEHPGSPDEPLAVAAVVLGGMGRASSTAAIVAAYGDAKRDDTRADVALQLTRLPRTDASRAVVEKAFASLPDGAATRKGSNARESLARAIADWDDPALVPWLLEAAAKVEKKASDRDAARLGLLATAMRLMKKDQLPAVRAAVKKLGGERDEKNLAEATAVLDACEDRVACLGEHLAGDAPFGALVAASALGRSKDPGAKPELLRRYPKLKSATARFAAANAVDHLSPEGDPKAAADLATIAEADEATKDPALVAANAPLRAIIGRLHAKVP